MLQLYAISTLFLAGASATMWGQFCDDTQCSINCGISVAIDNPGCLGEYNRNSVLFHDDELTEAGLGLIDPLYVPEVDFSLVLSPGSDCSCQVDCISNIVNTPEGPGCYDLTGHAYAESFRFIGGSCDYNNC